MRTSPTHWLDYVLRPLLKLLWEPVSKKQSHWWHWRNYRENTVEELLLYGNPVAKARDTFWSMFWQSNFGWKRVAILMLDDYSEQEYQLGFFPSNDPRAKQLCTLVLQGPTAVLIGPGNVRFFAIEFPSGRNIALRATVVTLSKRELAKDIPLI